MKKIIVLIIGIFLLNQLSAQEQSKIIKSKIKEVTVFFSGAQITQSGEVTIPAGQSTIMFDNLTQYINPQSIQVKGEGNFSILSVVHQINYLKTMEKTPEVLKIEDSLLFLNKKLSYQQTIMSVYTQEESMLLANKVIGGEQNGVKITELKEAVEYFRTRLTDIKTNLLNVQEKISALQIRISALNNQLNALQSKKIEPTSEILVLVNSETSIPAKMSLSYYVTNAGWSPTYDLRAININNPIEFNFKANVFQNTGTDWNHVNLTLSTANPLQNSTKPNLNPWYLSFNYQVGVVSKGSTMLTTVAGVEAAESSRPQTQQKEFYSKTMADFVSVSENQTNIEYEISIPYTIPADGKNYMVEIQKNSLPAQYEYYCAPKINNDVFLLAKVSGWEKFNIISGQVNLFFEGTYVGKSYIDTKVTTDTLLFSMGIDKNISVTREKLVDFSNVKTLGLNKKETRTYEINIRNKKKQPVQILIEDQLPLSTDKDIEVEQLELSGAFYDKDTGKCSWKYQIKSAETKTIRLSFSVKYPKDKSVSLY